MHTSHQLQRYVADQLPVIAPYQHVLFRACVLTQDSACNDEWTRALSGGMKIRARFYMLIFAPASNQSSVVEMARVSIEQSQNSYYLLVACQSTKWTLTEMPRISEDVFAGLSPR